MAFSEVPTITNRTARAAQMLTWARQHRRALVRLVWGMLAAVLLSLHLAAAPQALAALQTLCDGPICFAGQVFTNSIWVLDALGLSVSTYGLLNFAVRVASLLSYAAVSTLLIWRKPDDRMAVLGACMLLIDGASVTGMLEILAPQGAVVRWLLLSVMLSDTVLVTLFFCLFPHGRFGSSSIRWLAWFWIVILSVVVLVVANVLRFPELLHLYQYATLLIDFWLLSLVGIQIYRYRTARTATERQQTKWIMLGIMLGYGSFALFDLAGSISALTRWSMPLLTPLIIVNILYLFAPLVPIAFGMAILRARLYDIDIIISRALLYGALTVSVTGTYILIVGMLGGLVQVQSHPLIAFIALGSTAVALQPLHQYVQRGVNLFVYGRRDEPYVVLARLGQRLGGALSPHDVLPTVAETVRENLKLPYVAIALREHDQEVIAAASGAPVRDHLTIPLVYQHERIGTLNIGQRTPGAAFSNRERRLLEDLAGHISIAAHAVHLTRDLQASRGRIVTAREEERRRLQRDLHDELGPTLASLTMQLDAARALMTTDPDTSAELLTEVKEQLQATVGSVRRLVYELRPPVLDQFGLIAAIREHALQNAHLAGLRISFDAPDTLPVLPAAVEVAVYYIAVEAVNNVIRHADAQHCCIMLRVDSQLTLVVLDDGMGLPAHYRFGVGLHSMRERAAELGGTCTVLPVPDGGTEVRTYLPL